MDTTRTRRDEDVMVSGRVYYDVAAAIYSLGHGLHTFTANFRPTHSPSRLARLSAGA